MGNKSSSSSSLIAKNWQKVNTNIYKNILTSELVKQTIKNFQSHQELDSAFRKYVQRVNLSQLDIVKLVYFTKQNRGSSICTSSYSNLQSLNVYIQLVQQNLDSFIIKYRNQYIGQKGQGCFCQSIIKAAIFLSQKYNFFKVNSKIIWIDIIQNKKNLKKYRAKLWINQDCSSCDVNQSCSQQQMIISLKQLFKEIIVKNLLCTKVKHQEFQTKFRHFSTLKQLHQKLNQVHSINLIESNLNKQNNNSKSSQQNELKNVRSFSSNSYYPQKQKYNPNQSFGYSHINRTISTSSYKKKAIIQTSKLPQQIKISNLRNQTYITGFNNHEQKIVKKQPNYALSKFFSQNVKNQNPLSINSIKHPNISHYKQKIVNFNSQYSYNPLISNNSIKSNIQNYNEYNNKTPLIQICFNPKKINSSFNNSSKKIEIREFRTDEKATDPTDRTKNQVSSKFQQKQTSSVINSSRKNNCLAPNSLSSTYGASQFLPIKTQKQDFQINNYIAQIQQKAQTQKIQKRHSSKDHLSIRDQQSSSSKAYSTKNIVICEQQDNFFKKQQELDKKYENYCNKLKKITQDKKVQNQLQNNKKNNINQKKNSNLNLQTFLKNDAIKKQSVKMTKSINVSQQINESGQNSKQIPNKNEIFRNNYLNYASIDQIEQRQSFNFDYADIKQSKFIRTGSQEHVLNYPLKKKQSDDIKHNKQLSQLPYKIQQPSIIPKIQKKNVSLNLKDQLNNLLGSDNIKETNKSYSYKNHSLDLLSNNKSGMNGQVNSIYNESISNLSVPDQEQQNLKKSKREKQIIKKQMQSLLRVTTSNQDDHSIKAKVKHKREIFSELKAQALKILD